MNTLSLEIRRSLEELRKVPGHVCCAKHGSG
jgi:hypothetical protein